METRTIRIDVRIEPSLWELAKAFGHTHDLSASQVLRKALREFLERNRG